ncbi:MAG: bifunctional diaminohydroxyphosphoribosylaminopyrimidine deaminase/5-amino-6-(5-phosphoribosylamino)uracil reductase RibD [Sciscionella sp.]
MASTPIDAVAAMDAAIALAEAARGTTSPNPPVGCVILDSAGRMVGSGGTQPPGGPHAEVVALAEAGERARGATAYVTLEPCAHHGRTPPCTDALIATGIAEVHYAVADPTPVARGGGEALRRAGIVVHSGLGAAAATLGPLRAWLHFVRTAQPHITWKFAATLDGRVAAADGTSRWISSPESRAEVHRLRAGVDAIVVGRGTVLADDPQLTAREPDGALAARQPLRVVVGTGDLPEGARVCDDAAETLHLRTRDPFEVLAALVEVAAVDVLLEGGPRLAGGFCRAGAVHRLLTYIAPKLLGSGAPAMADAGVATITKALGFQVEGVTMSGEDVRISATRSGR